MNQSPSVDPSATLVEQGKEQFALISRAIAPLSESGKNIFLNQSLYHSALMIFGYGLPAIQLGGKSRPLEVVA